MNASRDSKRAVNETAAKRRRLPGNLREQRIIEQAAAFFADHGLEASTRQLAREMGVTQALLYRYFPSKQALLERVFEKVFLHRWDDAWGQLLGDREIALQTRLTRFYQAFAARGTDVSLRLFMHAGLGGTDLARRYSFPLTRYVIRPVIEELRYAAGLAGLADKPLLRGERELALMLHGGIVFINIRKHVYRMPLPDDLDDLVALHVATFMGGALDTLRALHAENRADNLTVPLVGGSVTPQ